MVGSGVLVVLAVGLGGLVLRQQMGKRVGSSTTKQETAASTTAPASEMRASLAKSSQGSGLPKVKGLEGMEDRLFSAANDNDLFPIQAQSGELDSQLGAGELAGESTISASDAQAAVPMASQMNGELNAGADVSRPAESSSESSAAELARPEPEWTDEERASWRATMENLKQKIGSQDYTAAGEAIAEARRSAVRAAQRAQLDRLSKTNELARAFHTGLVAAIQGLSAGEVFTVGSSTQASFVEGDDQHVIVRIRGENQSFALTEVPIGLAYGLVDLKLDREQPSSLASKAAFTAVHPAVANNELAMVRAREMLSQAIAAGVVAEDMAEIFSEER
jgi:hypothetical protein